MPWPKSRIGVNHPDVIDPAVLRTGRFDLHVELSLPTPAGIGRILRHHLGTEALPDLSQLIRAARGKTPSDIAAAIRHARAEAQTGATPLGLDLLLAAFAVEKVPDTPLARRIATHEAGHAVIAHLLDLGPVREMSLKSGSGEILVTQAAREATVAAHDDQIAFCLAGRAAEIARFGDASAGAGGGDTSDLAIATSLALHLERSTGLGLNGLVWEPAGPAGRAMTDAERQRVRQRLDTQARRAEALLAPHIDTLDRIAQALVTEGYLPGEEVQQMLPQAGPPSVCH